MTDNDGITCTRVFWAEGFSPLPDTRPAARLVSFASRTSVMPVRIVIVLLVSVCFGRFKEFGWSRRRASLTGSGRQAGLGYYSFSSRIDHRRSTKQSADAVWLIADNDLSIPSPLIALRTRYGTVRYTVFSVYGPKNHQCLVSERSPYRRMRRPVCTRRILAAVGFRTNRGEKRVVESRSML